jgi:hypothetical protein
MSESNRPLVLSVAETVQEHVRRTLDDVYRRAWSVASNQPTLGRSIAQLVRQEQENRARWLRAALRAQTRMDALAGDIRAELRRTTEQMERYYRECLPSNWRDFSTDQVDQAVDLALDTGLSLVWVPRAEIVEELLVASPTEREHVLRSDEPDVLHDLGACLDEITHSALRNFQQAGKEAVAAYRGGLPWASQALASAAISGAVHELFGEDTFADARERFEREHPSEEDMRLFRMRVLMWACARALRGTAEGLSGFNRHASLHGVFEDQYTEANALAVLLLLVGLLRELQPWFAREHPDEAG